MALSAMGYKTFLESVCGYIFDQTPLGAATQWLVAIGFAGIAFALPATFYFSLSLAVFWLVAFVSATHDIAADGYYMLALNTHEQSFYVGIRSTFYRIASVVGQGALVVVAGLIGNHTGDIPLAWEIVFIILSGLFLCFALYHSWALPKVEVPEKAQRRTAKETLNEFAHVFAAFFRKKQVGIAILFMLLYRLPEAQARQTYQSIPARPH